MVSFVAFSNQQRNTIEVGTSFPELALFYYLNMVFDCRFHPRFLTQHGEFEFDLFLPEFDILIEYDSYYYHLDKTERDSLKDKVAKELGYELIRIREKPLERVSTDSKTIFRKDDTLRALDFSIASVLLYIRREFELDFDLSLSTNRDKKNILLLRRMMT